MSRTAAAHRWLACAALCGAAPASADEITLAPGEGVADLAPFVRYVRNDIAPLEELAAAAALPEDAFAPVENSALEFGFTDRVLWLTFGLHNSSTERGRWVLDLGQHFAPELVVYEERASGERVLLRESPTVDFHARVLPHRNLLAQLELEPGERSRVLIGYRSSGATTLAASIATPEAFAEWNRVDGAINAAFHAAMTFMLLLGLAQAALLRARLQLYYAVYVGAAMLYIAQTDGTALQFLWPDLPRWNSFAALPLGVAFGVAAAVFARAFLRTRGHAVVLDRVLLGAIGIGIAWVGAAAFVDAAWLKRSSIVLAIGLSALCLIGAIVTWQRGRRSVRFYIVGSTAMLVAILLAAAAHLTVLPFSPHEGLQVLKGGVVFDALMFATAMADSTREIRAQRDAAVERALAAVAEQEHASQRLHAARKAEIEARLLADEHGRALASASRSVQEPIAALRAAIEGLAHKQRIDAEAAARLDQGVDYLERLARRYSGRAARGSTEHGTFQIGALLAALDSLFHDAAQAKGLALRCHPSSLEARGDATATLRILSNLVENAIKYTPAGKVLVGCRRRGKDSLSILVADTGPGMSDADLAAALEPYWRGAGGAEVAGTGLGLAIAARLSASQGYELRARTQPGRGSVFELVVRRARPESVPAHEHQL
jgi:signal transduction histidine kinase